MFELIKNNNNNFFEDFFNKDFMAKNPLTTDIVEKDGVYTLSANLAEFDKDDISIEFKNGYLIISAEKSEKEEGTEDNYYLKESRSSVKRSFYVGKTYSEEDFNAKFENGILNVEFKEPKEEEEIKQIEIK